MDEDTVGIILLAINIIAFSYFYTGGFIRISENTSTKLNIIFRPKLSFFLAIITSSFIFSLLPGFFSFIPIQKIICEHSIQNNSTVNHDLNAKQKNIQTYCKVIDMYWFNYEKKTRLIPNIIEAKIETEIKEKIVINGKDLSRIESRMILLTQLETIPLNNYRLDNSGTNELRLLASSINEFLVNNEDKKFVGIVDDRYIGYIGFGSIIFLIIVFLLLTLIGLFINFCFDKETNLLTISRYRCFGMFGKEVFKYSLNEIIDVKDERILLSSLEDTYGSQVVLVVSDNEFFLNPIGLISKYIKGDYIVMTIKRFLEVK